MPLYDLAHMDLSNPPSQYWHCSLKLADRKDIAILNDLRYEDVQRTIVRPWLAGQPFTIAGAIVRSSSDVSEIKIVHTSQPQQAFANQHDALMQRSGIADWGTNRRLLPFASGEDLTFDLLFSGGTQESREPEVDTIEVVCKRLPQVARTLAKRARKGKPPFEIKDEYDVQDLLHATI